MNAECRRVLGVAHAANISTEHVGRGYLVDNTEVDGLAPEFREPAADNRLVIFFLAHSYGSLIRLDRWRRQRPRERLRLILVGQTPLLVVEFQVCCGR
jgi:hypothetical protein